MAASSSIPGASAPNTNNDPTGKTTANSTLQLKPGDFMTLLTTQLLNQNPTSPMDSSTMLQQMSSLGSIQTMTDMGQKMDALSQSMQTTMGNSQVLEATQLVGKNVEVESGLSPLTQNADQSLTLSGSAIVPGAASDVTVTISDPTGQKVVKTLDLGPASGKGLMDFTWDGKDAAGNAMPPGYYTISASANVAGKSVPIGTAGSFAVKSVALGSNGVILNLDGIGGQDMGSVIKIL
jgi:flagellar basal-body rod modification protein FlgD